MAFLEQLMRDRLDARWKQLNGMRPLPAAVVRKLQEQFQMEMTYNSNAIEGNSLTLNETYLVIREGITVKNKPLKDHLEAQGHHKALQFIAGLFESKKRFRISESLIRKLHQLLLNTIDAEISGKYRSANVIIVGARHTPPDAREVPRRMKALLKWMQKNTKKIHPVEYAALLHHQFVHIHPFFDGNGRMARLLMNVSLMGRRYPIVCILKNDRMKYYRVLAEADQGNYTPFVRFIAQSVERSLGIYLKVLAPSGKKGKKFLPLSKISPQTPYSAKYLNLLVRQGKLEARKEGRNWLVSLEAVKRYRQSRRRKR